MESEKKNSVREGDKEKNGEEQRERIIAFEQENQRKKSQNIHVH